MNASVSLPQGDTRQPPLRFHLLGVPTIVWNDTVLAIPRRSARALLCRLACDSDPVARGHLHMLFWPDIPEPVARRNLSHLLTHLRRALPLPEILVATRDQAGLEPSQTWSDVLEFKNAIFDPKTEVPFLVDLVSLYRGPFLEGFSLPRCPEFEYWCIVERTALEHRYLKILERLVEQCIRTGEVDQAIQYAQQYLETDSLSETIHRRLIQLYAAIGDRHRALQQFERCSSVLEADLGVSPLPETRAAYQAVLVGQPRFPEPPSPLRLPRLSGMETPLIGREAELRKLEEAFPRSNTQRGHVVFIAGEAGIGKSRLMRHFAEQHLGEAHLLYGSGHAGEQAIPYQPILTILRTILSLQETGTGARDSTIPAERSLPDFIEPFWLSEIARLLPEMHVIFPELPLPLPLEPESARTRLFDAVYHTILAYARAQGPLLLCLDDLQWMDASSKACLVHIGRFLTRSGYPILILGAYLSEEAEEILNLRHTLARAGVLTELHLSGLKEADVLEVLHHLVGWRAGDEMLAGRLHQATGGNPFYLLETVHKIIEEGRLEEQFQELAQLPLPESVREAVQARLQRLSPIARQVLEAGAVLGHSFSLELLRFTAGRSHAEIMSALEELLARVLLVEALQGYRFRHEIIRQHVEERLGKVRGQLLHRRAGRAYQRLNPDAFPALAYHFELGGDLEKALHYHGLAAHHAQTLFAWQTAEYHQGCMLDLLVQIDPDGERSERIRQRGEILAERAYSRYLQGRQAERDADLDALSLLGETSRDGLIRLRAILNRLRYLNQDGEYALATVVAEKGLALLESSHPLFEDAEQAAVARSRLLAQTGLAYYFLGKPLTALDALEEAWSLCGDKADPEACGRILHILGYVHAHLGDYARSLECQQQAYVYHAEAGDSNRMAWDQMDIGALHKTLGDLATARRFLEEGLELSSRVGSQQAKVYGLSHLGSLSLHEGDYTAAAEHYKQALEMQPVTPSEHVISMAEAGTGSALYHLGEYAQSRHWLERALQRARATDHRQRAAKTSLQLALLDMVEGRLSLARQHLDEGLAMAEDCRSGECLAAGMAMRARLERLADDPTRALETASNAVSTAQQFKLTGCEMWGEIEAGLACLGLGDPSSALEHTQRAASLAAQASQDWIGREEAYRAQALVLRALGQGESVDYVE